MSTTLEEKVLAVIQKPRSVNTRAALVTALEEENYPDTQGLWEHAIRLAASKGDFFAALALARFHLDEAKAEQLLHKLAAIFAKGGGGKAPSSGTSLQMPAMQTFEDPQARLDFAVKVARSLLQVDKALEPAKLTFPLFSALSPDTFVALALHIKPVPLVSGQVLVRQEERDQTLYLLTHGVVEVSQQRGVDKKVKLAVVKAPTLIGEMSLFNSTARRATVISKGEGLAWEVTEELLKMLTKTHPGLSEELRELIERRQMNNLMRTSKIFQNTKERDNLVQAFAVQKVEPGEEIFPQGAPAPGLFIILHGEASVTSKNTTGQELQISTLREGDAFGEISLLTNAPTSGAVHMPQGGLLLHMAPETFRSLRSEIPDVDQELKRLMEVRKMNDLIFPVEERSGYSELDVAWILGEY